MKQPVSSKEREREFRRSPRSHSGAESATAGGAARGNGRLDTNKPPRPDKTTRRKYLKAYVAWLWPQRFAILVILLMALTVAALDMVWPLGIKLIIDAVSSSGSRPIKWSVGKIGIVIVCLLTSKQSLDSFRSYRTSLLNSRIIFRLRGRLFDKLMHLSLNELGDM